MDLILKVFSWPKMIADASGIISASYLHYRLKASSMEGEESFLLVKVYFFIALFFINNGLFTTFLLSFLQEELKHLAL